MPAGLEESKGTVLSLILWLYNMASGPIQVYGLWWISGYNSSAI